MARETENPPAATSATKKPAPFAFADFTWLTGTSRQEESILDTLMTEPGVGYRLREEA